MAPLAPPHPAILLHDAVALSGRFPLLAGLDLEVAVGETVLVEGPNGAGKTSLLRVCAGLVPLSSGVVTVLGLDPIRHRTQVRRRVGLLSHASHLYDDLTVRENVRFAVRAAGADTGRIAGACDRWGLTGRLLKTSASKLSAGQRRRVALAVLTARWPELWLLDEPHAGLDASARETLDQLVGEAGGGRGHGGHRLPRDRVRRVAGRPGRHRDRRAGDRSPGHRCPSATRRARSAWPGRRVRTGARRARTATPVGPGLRPASGRPAGEVAHVA